MSSPVVTADKTIHTYTNYSDVQGTMDYYWVMGDNYHNGVINVDNYPIRIRLLCYGLSQQAKFGDLPTDQERPSAWNIKGGWKYDAYKKQYGRPRTDARNDFI